MGKGNVRFESPIHHGLETPLLPHQAEVLNERRPVAGTDRRRPLDLEQGSCRRSLRCLQMTSNDGPRQGAPEFAAGPESPLEIGTGRDAACTLPEWSASCRLLDAAPDGIVLLDVRGRIQSFNRAARRAFGAGASEFAGRPFESLLSAPLAVPLDWSAAAATTSADAPRQRSPDGCRGRRADGTEFPLDFEIACIASLADDGPGARFAVFFRDLSLEWTLPVLVQRAEQRLRALVDLSPMALWIAQDDRVIFANRAAAQLLGFGAGSDLIGLSIYALLDDDVHSDLRQQLVYALAQDGQLGKVQGRLLCRTGERREVEIALAALPDHGRTTVQMVVSDVSQRNRERREIERSRHLLKRLSANVVDAREEERRRIARELHDELGQSLTALKMEIADCARASGLVAGSDRVSALLARLDEITKSVRRIATDLRPLMLDDLGLGDAIESLANDFARRLGILVHLHVDPIDTAIDEKQRIALYRMVQEALTNVARHAQATVVHVDLRHGDGGLVLSVHDNGVGLPSAEPSPRDSQFGLLGIQERADALGGHLTLDSPPEGGVRMLVCLPTKAPDRSRTMPGHAGRNRVTESAAWDQAHR